ncbi:MAG: hypothetical protein AAGH78_04630 [Cyanobacteria bacterium P01_H01_bin.58]
MQILKTRGLVPLLVLGAISALPRLFPQAADRVFESVAEVTAPTSVANSEHYQLVPGSIYDGDTLRVTDGSQEIKIRLCGIDAPEKEQPMGIESRDHLRSLVAQGDGAIIVVPVERINMADWWLSYSSQSVRKKRSG